MFSSEECRIGALWIHYALVVAGLVVLIEVDERESCQQPLVVLLNAAIAHLHGYEYALWMRNGHTTLQRTLALVRYLRFCSWFAPALVFMPQVRLMELL